MNLEMTAMRWLWLDKGCHIVLEQRSPKYMNGEPDVLGVSAGRHLVEIEIKRSASDFRADAKKHHRANREHYLHAQPRQFYYLMPHDLAVKLKDKIPDWAGLMSSKHDFDLTVLKTAPVNYKAEKMTPKECIRLMRQMTAHMMGYALKCNSLYSRYMNDGYFDSSDYVEAEKGTYTI